MGLPGAFPPCSDPAAFKREYQLVPEADREDALQEAWVAHLEGRDPVHALKAHAERERRHRQRHTQLEQDGSSVSATDKDGTRRQLAASQKSESSAAPVRRNSLRKAG